MNLRTQITLIICTIIILLMTLLGTVIYIKSASIIDKEAENYMIAQLDRVQENIDMLVRINMLETKGLSLDKKVQSFLEKKVDVKEINPYLTELMKEKNKVNNYYMDLFILNNNGKIVATCMPIAMNLDLSTREYVRKSVQTKEVITSDILFARSNGALVVNTVAPITNTEGKVLGYAGVAIYAEYFSDIVSSLKLRESGYYAIIDSNNLILSHPNRSLVGKPSIFGVTNDLFKDDKIIKRSALGLDNTKEIQIFKHIKNKNWILVAALPQKDMYTQSKSLLVSVIAIGVIALVIAIFLGIYVSNRISVPIVAVTEYMDIISKESSTLGKSISESIGMLRKSYENIGEENIDNSIEQNRYHEITRLSQSFANLKRNMWSLIKSFENESKNLMKTSEKMALTIGEIYNGTSKFILTLSHDLKNSLTVIKGYSKGLKAGIIEDENLKNDFISAIYERTEELEKIIYDVLDSAYEAQTITRVNKQAVDLEGFAQSLVGSAMQYITNSGGRFDAFINVKPGKLFIDETKIKRVWNNLISNAVKYSSKDSLITVRVISEKNKIRCEIEDQGIGIDKDELDKISNMFFRGKDINEKGYGLGLFICKSILELHNSKLYVESEKGRGSNFWFYIETT